MPVQTERDAINFKECGALRRLLEDIEVIQVSNLVPEDLPQFDIRPVNDRPLGQIRLALCKLPLTAPASQPRKVALRAR